MAVYTNNHRNVTYAQRVNSRHWFCQSEILREFVSTNAGRGRASCETCWLHTQPLKYIPMCSLIPNSHQTCHQGLGLSLDYKYPLNLFKHMVILQFSLPCSIKAFQSMLYVAPTWTMLFGKLLHAVGPATQNARLPRRRLVRGTTRSPRTADQ